MSEQYNLEESLEMLSTSLRLNLHLIEHSNLTDQDKVALELMAQHVLDNNRKRLEHLRHLDHQYHLTHGATLEDQMAKALEAELVHVRVSYLEDKKRLEDMNERLENQRRAELDEEVELRKEHRNQPQSAPRPVQSHLQSKAYRTPTPSFRPRLGPLSERY